MSFRAVITDLDGTLLNEHHSISPYTLETLQLLKNKGVAVIFATGRPYPNVFSTIDGCGLQGGYLITSNGSRVFDPQRRLIAEHNLDPDIVKELLSIRHDSGDAQEPPFSTNIYRHDSWLTNHSMSELLQAFSKSSFFPSVVDLSECPHDGVHAVFYVGETKKLLTVEETIKSRFHDKVELSFSAACYLDVVPRGVHKGNAMLEVANLLGISTKEIIAFGDGMNDLTMLQMSGKGCIMSNAQTRLKEALPNLEVIGSHTEDGVAKKLREVFGL